MYAARPVTFSAASGRIVSVQISLHVGREGAGRFVTPLAVFLERLHHDPVELSVEQARELLRRYPPSPESEHGVLGVIRTGKPELIPIITDEIITKSAKDVEHLRMLVELGLSSSMIVPMVARGRTLGAFAFFSTESGRRFGPNDLALAQDLARRAALSVDNARLYQRAQALNEELEQRVVMRTADLQAANDGVYSVVARNELGAVTNHARLTVVPSAPIVLVQPAGQTVTLEMGFSKIEFDGEPAVRLSVSGKAPAAPTVATGMGPASVITVGTWQ